MYNKRTHLQVSFRLNESDFKYLDNTDLLRAVLALQFPIKIIKVVKKKYRGVDRYYHHVTAAIHKSDMADMDATITHEYPKHYRYRSNDESRLTTEDKYSRLVSDLIGVYSDSMDETLRVYRRPKVQKESEGVHRGKHGSGAYVWRPKSDK